VEDGVHEQTEAEDAFPVGSDRTGQSIQKGEMKSIDGCLRHSRQSLAMCLSMEKKVFPLPCLEFSIALIVFSLGI
jgi:hypothetical protein